MPRYLKEPLITFTDASGNSYELRSPQEIQSLEYQFALNIDIKNNDELDEIAQRRNIYGERKEFFWYKIFDYNVVEIVENDFSINNLKKLKIPR